MLLPKNILSIPDYKFPNGNISPKILLVLANKDISNEVIIYTLTTSQTSSLPPKYLKQGCHNKTLERISMFVFEKDTVVGTKPDGQPFTFHEDYTVIQAQNNVIAISTSKLLEQYSSTIKLIGTFNDTSYKRILKCLRQSDFFQMNLRNFLQIL